LEEKTFDFNEDSCQLLAVPVVPHGRSKQVAWGFAHVFAKFGYEPPRYERYEQSLDYR